VVLVVFRNVPDPEVLIRTSGELRVSNFLMYQIAYSELIFVDKMWPALTYDDFVAILEEFNRRQRRFGT
jgi:undecaprenyl diphosphate synthase